MTDEYYCWHRPDGSEAEFPDGSQPGPWRRFDHPGSALAFRARQMHLARTQYPVATGVGDLALLVLCRVRVEEVADSVLPAPPGQLLALLLNDGETYSDANGCVVVCVDDADVMSVGADAAVVGQRVAGAVVEMQQVAGQLVIHLYRHRCAFDLRIEDHADDLIA